MHSRMVVVSFIATCLTDESVSDNWVVLECGWAAIAKAHAEECHCYGKSNANHTVKATGSRLPCTV